MPADREALTRGIPYVEGRHYCVDPETGCWEWAGTLLRGYAHSSGVRPHRRMYLAVVGAIPAGCDLHHECHNRACINPAHLRPIERVNHRRIHQREDSPVTGEQVIELRTHAATGIPLVRLAEQYGLHPSSVKDIVWGFRWAEVGGPIGRPETYCATCGQQLSGMRHQRYCGRACRKQAEYAAKRAKTAARRARTRQEKA